MLCVGDQVSTLFLVSMLLLFALFKGIVPAQAQPPPLWSYEAEDYVWSVSILDNGEYIAAGSWDNNVTLFEYTGSEPIRSYETGSFVQCVSFAGVWAVAGCSNGYVHHIPKPGSSSEWSYDLEYPVLSVSSNYNGVYFVTGDMGNNISSFYYSSSTPRWQYATFGDVSAVAISDDGNTIVAGNLEGEVYLLDNDWSPTLLWWYRIGDTPPFHDVDSVAISYHGDYIAVGSGIGDHKIYLFNNLSSTPLWSYTAGNRVFSVDISDDGEYIAAASFDNKVYLFNRTSSEPLWSYTTGGDVFSVDISDDGEYIAAGSSDNKVYLFSRRSSTPLWSYTTGGTVRSVSIGAQDQVIRIAAGTASPSDHKVYLFEHTSCDFEMQFSAGWNMVSFPCLPPDPNFTNIFSSLSFYQALTWNGVSYIDVSTEDAEPGWGYWVLVLEDCTVTITNGIPVESYERDLDTGWSMIGSITCTVDPDCVFPSYYQLLTWDGTSYISSTTIEPGRGYWTLVLEDTHIVVNDSSCIPS